MTIPAIGPAAVPLSPWPPRRCPRHRHLLDGGPIHFRCPEGHAVVAADLDTEYRPASKSAA